MSHLTNQSAPGRRWRGRPLAVALATAMTAALSAGLLAAIASPAAASSAAPTDNGVYQLELRHPGNVLTGLAIDVPGNSPDPDTQLALWPRNDGDNQRFELREAGNGYYRIVTRQSYYRSGETGLLCLDVAGASTQPLAAIVQHPCHGGDNQLWRPMLMASGNYGLQAKHSGRYLSYAHTEGGDLTGARLIQDTDPAAWHLTPSSFWYPTTAVDVQSGFPYRQYVEVCQSGWHPRKEASGKPYYENIGDRRWTTNVNALINAKFASGLYGLKVDLVYTWLALPGEPFEITGQIRLFCDPN